MKIKYLIWCAVALLCLASCKEEDDTIEEFPNWVAANDAYFSQLVADTRAKIAAGDTSWELFLGHNIPTTGHSNQYYDYIVVQKLASVGGSGSALVTPILTDTVQVHCKGNLKPSASKYKDVGMQFYTTYNGVYMEGVSTPAQFAVSQLVPGFSTAVMHMQYNKETKEGDYWRVYIPYQLAYGTTTSGSIPGGSTLIYEIRLANCWRRK